MFSDLTFDNPIAMVINVLIILILLADVIAGYKKGFLEHTIKFVRILVSMVGAYLLKGPLSTYMYTNLPFFDLDGLFDGVTSINFGTFKDCHSLKYVVLGDNIKTIYDNAFYFCYNLQYIIFPDKLTEIAEDVFINCSSLNKIYVGKNLAVVCKDAFADTNNTEDIYYAGTQEQWEAINNYMRFPYDATKHYSISIVDQGTCGDGLFGILTVKESLL